MDLKKSETLSHWDKWKNTLAKGVKLGETVGLSNNAIDEIAFRIGNVLSAAVDPENREERLLQELWKVGDDEDRRTLAKLIVKMLECDHN